MKCITYERDVNGTITRAPQHLVAEVNLSEDDRQVEYPYPENLRGWPERRVYWTQPYGEAVGVAPA